MIKISANRIIFPLKITNISSRKLETEKSISVSSIFYRNLLSCPSSAHLFKLYCKTIGFCKTILVIGILRSQDVEHEFSDPCRKITTRQKENPTCCHLPLRILTMATTCSIHCSFLVTMIRVMAGKQLFLTIFENRFINNRGLDGMSF